MATNPLEETVLSEDINVTEIETGMAAEERTVSVPANESYSS